MARSTTFVFLIVSIALAASGCYVTGEEDEGAPAPAPDSGVTPPPAPAPPARVCEPGAIVDARDCVAGCPGQTWTLCNSTGSATYCALRPMCTCAAAPAVPPSPPPAPPPPPPADAGTPPAPPPAPPPPPPGTTAPEWHDYRVVAVPVAGDPALTITISQQEAWGYEITPAACIARSETGVATLTSHECSFRLPSDRPAVFGAQFDYPAATASRQTVMWTCVRYLNGAPYDYADYGTILVYRDGGSTPVAKYRMTQASAPEFETRYGCAHHVSDTPCPGRLHRDGAGHCVF